MTLLLIGFVAGAICGRPIIKRVLLLTGLATAGYYGKKFPSDKRDPPRPGAERI